MPEHMALQGTYGANEIPKVRMQYELAPKSAHTGHSSHAQRLWDLKAFEFIKAFNQWNKRIQEPVNVMNILA